METCEYAEEVFGIPNMITCKNRHRRVARGQMRHVRDCQSAESCGLYAQKTGRMRNTPKTRGHRVLV
jgi:hypothetical protein